jgi:hypothetical protein
MTASTFLFATGIENSYPTINGGRTRIDEMEKCGHYTLWKTDFDLLDEVGIRYLRYGPPRVRPMSESSLSVRVASWRAVSRERRHCRRLERMTERNMTQPQ